MCGRYTLSVPLSNLVDSFDVDPPDFDYPPRFNIAPTQAAPVIAQDQDGRRMGLLRWGLVPSWAKDPAVGSRMINARSETVAEKPAFRAAFRRRRCVVPADGFFEWKQIEGGGKGKPVKAPHWIHRPEAEPFVMAGLWEKWNPPDGAALYTFTILTTEAIPEIREIHARMPVILPEAAVDLWLDPQADPTALPDLLQPYPGGLEFHRVSTTVNSPQNDLSDCIERVDPE